MDLNRYKNQFKSKIIIFIEAIALNNNFKLTNFFYVLKLTREDKFS